MISILPDNDAVSSAVEKAGMSVGSPADLVVCDLAGVRAMRQRGDPTPAIIVSPRRTTLDIYQGLMSGADDYLVEPFHPDELVARIKAVLRRSVVAPRNVIDVGDLRVDVDGQCVYVAGKKARLTTTEYRIVLFMARTAPLTATREAVFDFLYARMREPQAKVLDVFLWKIRKKIPGARIETVWGRGWRLVAINEKNGD